MGRKIKELSPSEAIIGFCAWLTTRDGVIKLSAKHDCSLIVKCIEEFANANNLPRPRITFDKVLKFPTPETNDFLLYEKMVKKFLSEKI